MTDVCDPNDPRYVLGVRGGYSITLKQNNHVIWTREGVRCRACAVYVDLATMDVFDATGPHALQKIKCEVVVRHGLHSPDELMPIVENLVPATQKGDIVVCDDGRVFKAQSCIKGSQQVLIGPDNQAFLGAGLMYGTMIVVTPVAPRAVLCISSTQNIQRKSNMSKAHKVTASPRVWSVYNDKGTISDPVATKALEKFIEQHGKRGKITIVEREQMHDGLVSSFKGARMFKGTLAQVVEQLKQAAIAQAQQEANIVVAEESYGNKVAGQIYGDIKAIAAKLKSWKKSMTKEEYAQYEAYQKGVIKHVLSEVLPKLPKEYQDKIKAI